MKSLYTKTERKNYSLKKELINQLKEETLTIRIQQDASTACEGVMLPPVRDYITLFKERTELLANTFMSDIEDSAMNYVYDEVLYRPNTETVNLIALFKARHRKIFEKIIKLVTGCKEIAYDICDFFILRNYYRLGDLNNVVIPSIAQLILDNEVLLYKFLFDTDFIYSTKPINLWKTIANLKTTF